MNKQKNIPTLRFPEFKDEWEVKRYGDIFSFRTTNSFSRENLNYESGEIKNIHYGDIHTKFSTLFDITKELVPFVNPEIELERITYDNYCCEGDLIIADASEDYEDVGKCIEIVNLNEEKVLAGLHTILARPDRHKMSIGFNGYLMKSENIRLQIKTVAQGIKVLSISSKRLAELNLTIPEIPEQQKIATFLTAVDDKLTQLKKKKKLLEQYKKGVMQKLLLGKLRFNEYFFDEKQKSLYGYIPKDWKLLKIKDAADKLWIGLVTTMTTNYVENGIPLIRNSDIRISGINTTNLINLSKEFANKHKSRAFKIGDIATVHTGDVGVSAIITTNLLGSIGFATLNTRWDNNYISNVFVKHFFNSDVFRNLCVSYSTGDGRQNLNLKDFENFLIPLPCLKEQTKIANFLSAIDDKVNLVNEQIEKTGLWKKGLLQKMFC